VELLQWRNWCWKINNKIPHWGSINVSVFDFRTRII
jgi:hypothetical protein